MRGVKTAIKEVLREFYQDGLRNLRVDDCTVVTWDDEAELDSGIKVVPAWKWFLKENSR